MSPSLNQKTEVRCHCGRPLHYKDPLLRKQLEDLVSKLGPNVEVAYEGRTYLVPRHYIALHGIKGVDISSLGFTEVTRR